MSEPIPMRLVCEDCGILHIDEGEFATKPHHTHACQHCGLVWRPAVVATVGVQFLPGFKNERMIDGHQRVSIGDGQTRCSCGLVCLSAEDWAKHVAKAGE